MTDIQPEMECPMLAAIPRETFLTIHGSLSMTVQESKSLLATDPEKLTLMLEGYNTSKELEALGLPPMGMEAFLADHSARIERLKPILERMESSLGAETADLSWLSTADRDFVSLLLFQGWQAARLLLDCSTRKARAVLRYIRDQFRETGVSVAWDFPKAIRSPKRFFEPIAESLIAAVNALNPDGTGCRERDCMCA